MATLKYLPLRRGFGGCKMMMIVIHILQTLFWIANSSFIQKTSCLSIITGTRLSLRGGSMGAEDGAPSSKQIPVTFHLHCRINMTSEAKVLIIGSSNQLGAWNPAAGVEMTACDARSVWTAEVMLPAGMMLDYKYAISNPNKTFAIGNATMNAEKPNTSITNNTAQIVRIRPHKSRADSANTIWTSVKLDDHQFLRGGVVFDWEAGGNHIVKVSRRPHTVTDEFMLDNLRNTDSRPPSFVSQGSQTVMDAEYYYVTGD